MFLFYLTIQYILDAIVLVLADSINRNLFIYLFSFLFKEFFKFILNEA